MSTTTDAAVDGPSPDGAVEPALGWLTWPKLVVLVAAFAWLAGALTYVVLEVADRPPGAGSVDVGFLQDMAVHHEQAVEMAVLQLANGQDPTAIAFAKEVLAWQSYELGLMDQQLRAWGRSRQDRAATAMGWMGMPVPVASMPGLATEAEMAELADARGADADARFLQLMTEHHAGGVHMAQHAAQHAEAGAVRDLAAQLARNQAIEIAEFELVADRLDVELDPGSVALGQDPLAGARS